MSPILLYVLLFIEILLQAPSVAAFWRLPCHMRTGIGRIDPVVSFGRPSDHAHILFGGQGMGFTASQAVLNASQCTSCAVTQDRSAYWTPPLMFMDVNGTFELVQQVGGMLAYYFLNGENITAFPSGFRMISGDTYQRNFTLPVPDPPQSFWTGIDITQPSLRQKALGFNCLNYSRQPDEGSLQRHTMPNKTFLDTNCLDGLRLELMFPSCWNGKDVDSPNHKDHVAFPELVMDGDCPDGYPIRFPGLFYETIFDTYAFNDRDGQFVLSNGDPTGCGYHGDFIQAWDPPFLQQAIDICTNKSGKTQDCPIFDIQDDGTAAQCTINMPTQLLDENCTETMTSLPGNVTVQYGPAYATKQSHGMTQTSEVAYSGLTTPTSLPSLSDTAAAPSTVPSDPPGTQEVIVVQEIHIVKELVEVVEETPSAAPSSAAAHRHRHRHHHGHEYIAD